MTKPEGVEDPLTSTFCFAPGVGETTERKLWAGGIVHWDHVDAGPGALLGAARRRALKDAIDRARRDLEAGRPDFVRDGLKNVARWRAYPRFRRSCAYLDIETTGLDSWSQVTLIGVYDGRRLTILERDKDLHEFPEHIRQYEMIVSFNGLSFDIPFLQREFPRLRFHQAHWDLRWALRQVGHRGGLKEIERRFGLDRPGPLAELGGFDAVILWNAYQRGDEAALPILRRYLAEDVMGLKPLAERAFNLLAAGVPLPIAPLEESDRPACELEFDAQALRRLKR